MNTFIFGLSAICLYLVTAVLQFHRRGDTSSSAKYLLLIVGLLAISFHTVELYQNVITPTGFNFGFFNAGSLMMWSIVLLLFLALFRKPVDNLIIVLFPLAALAIGIEKFFYTERILSIDYQWGITLHIVFSLLNYSLITLSALQAVFLAIQDYQLHGKHPKWAIQRLPPLQIMENLLFQMIGLGVSFLSLSLITGFLFVEDLFIQHLVHKTVLSIIAWCVFTILLWGHWQYGWRGRTAIKWNLSGFVVLMLAYFGSKFVLELILKK
jgi:ABC-type uncharacterized transport system permease subunit